MKKENSENRANIEAMHTLLKNAIGGDAAALDAITAFLAQNGGANPEQPGVTWEFIKESGTLILSGKGETEDYAVYRGGGRRHRNRPWEAQLDKIRAIEVRPGVTALGHRVFAECYNLESVILPEGLERIGKSAFEECGKLASVVIPEGVTLIDDDAFHCCFALQALSLPDSVERIGDFAFAECAKLRNVRIPKNLRTIGEYAFIEEAL